MNWTELLLKKEPAPQAVVSSEYVYPIHHHEKKYKCIYADPPWDGDVFWNEEYTSTYPLLKDSQLLGMAPQIRELAPSNAHLWMWTIAGKLEFALQLGRAWGFRESHFVFWQKDWLRMGKIRNMGELLLFFDQPNAPILQKDIPNHLYTPHWRGEHSEKPDEIRKDFVERGSPGPRLELFCRGKPLGREHEWDAWGNEPSMKNDVTIHVPWRL